jgi:hypothetical protein
MGSTVSIFGAGSYDSTVSSIRAYVVVMTCH